jgi:DNA-binding response OmpR family regulator
MRILIVTARPATFADFLAALQQRGVEVILASTAGAATELAKTRSPALCVVDDSLADAGPFALVAGLMRANAFLHTAVVTDLSPEDFHEAGEGLGILMPLPRQPGAAEAEALLETLATVV